MVGCTLSYRVEDVCVRDVHASVVGYTTTLMHSVYPWYIMVSSVPAVQCVLVAVLAYWVLVAYGISGIHGVQWYCRRWMHQRCRGQVWHTTEIDGE